MTDGVVFRDILEGFGRGADKNRQGIQFEHMMLCYFKSEGSYIKEFRNVWKWSDPEQPLQKNPKYSGHDYGVDLVGESKRDGALCAIQCKYYNRDHALNNSELNKFLTAASYEGSPFASKILVYTGKKITPNQERKLEEHKCRIIRYRDLENIPILENSCRFSD